MLENIRIASPCSVNWEQMKGDDRVRHCAACNLNVYNLSEFTEPEIRRLIAEREGRLCARLYRRADGTMITQNCPVGLKAVTRRLARVASAILSVMIPGLAWTAPAVAQSYTAINMGDAAVQVEVIDPSGAHVPDAVVTLTDLSRDRKFQGKTDRNGRLVLRGPLGGRYSVNVKYSQFNTFSSTVELRNGHMLSLPVQLNFGLMGDVVMVDPGSKPDKNPSTSQSGSVPHASAPRPLGR